MLAIGDKVIAMTNDEYNDASGTVCQVWGDGYSVHLNGWTYYVDGYFFESHELRKVEG